MCCSHPHLSASFRSRFQSRHLSRLSRQLTTFAGVRLYGTQFFMANAFAASKEDFNSSYINIGSYFRLLLRFIIFCICGSVFKFFDLFFRWKVLKRSFQSNYSLFWHQFHSRAMNTQIIFQKVLKLFTVAGWTSRSLTFCGTKECRCTLTQNLDICGRVASNQVTPNFQVRRHHFKIIFTQPPWKLPPKF